MLSDYNNIITPNKTNFNFLDYKEVPRYLKQDKKNNNIDFKYAKGTLLVPDIVDRINSFLELNNLIHDKIFILKKVRKLLAEVTSDERKRSKQISIKNARQKQCEKYNNIFEFDDAVNDDTYNTNLDDTYINNTKDYLKNINYKITPRKSTRLRKKATKYNPYTGKSQIVGTGKKLIYLRK